MEALLTATEVAELYKSSIILVWQRYQSSIRCLICLPNHIIREENHIEVAGVAVTKAMEVQKVLHMVRGIGENSYANNSGQQRSAIAKVKPIVQKTIIDLYSSTLTESFAIGDLGCSFGPNTLIVISEIIDAIDWGSRQLNRPMPELTIFLNDLPGNDFNSIFQSLTAFYEKIRREKGERLSSCFIAGMPGSFYGRLFRRRSLHFIHSSYSLHWLSQVPPELSSGSNKGNIYLSETSPPFVFEAYLEQFKRDFQSFLRSRSEELVSGGRMVLALLGRRTAVPHFKESCDLWKLLAQALYDLVSRGLIEEAKLDAFNLPYYAPSVEELTEAVQKEDSFILNQLDIIQVSWDGSEDDDEGNNPAAPFDEVARGLNVAKIMRAVAEPLLVSHFGVAFMDEVFQRYGQILAEHLSIEKTKDTVLVVTLKRNG